MPRKCNIFFPLKFVTFVTLKVPSGWHVLFSCLSPAVFSLFNVVTFKNDPCTTTATTTTTGY